MFKAIELDPRSRQRTGRALTLQAETRQGAVEELLRQLGKALSEARQDPTGTLVEVDGSLWTIVGVRAAGPDAPGLRRAGAKHKRVR